MILWPQHARALIALAARLRVCTAVETTPFSDYVYNGRNEGGVYEGEQFITDDYYIVIAKRVRRNVEG